MTPADGERRARESALAYAEADKPEGVDGGDDERDSVDSGDGRETGQDRAVHLGDAEQVPGQAGDAGAGEFYRDPGEGYQ